MAKNGVNIQAQVDQIARDAQAGIFKPVYLLMGDEPYYPDRACEVIMKYAVEEDARDFDQFVFYGADANVNAEAVITAARGYSMYGGRVLVVLKEAQLMKDLEQLSYYVEKPLDSTVLVVVLHGATVDKRKAFYKAVQKIGEVVDSPALRDYEVAGWVESYYRSRGLDIDPEAAALLAEYAGTSIDTIVLETDKLQKNLPQGAAHVAVSDIENNVGISRQFSPFELAREVSLRHNAQALRIAAHLGTTARFQATVAVSALFMQFSRILKLDALLLKNPRPSQQEKVEAVGVNPFFLREYENAARQYPLQKCMAAISLLDDYDFKSKGGDIGPDTSQGEILIELISKLLNI